MKKYFIFILILVAFIFSCKTQKNIIELKDITANSSKKCSEVETSKNTCEWYDAKFKAEITDKGKSNKVIGRVKMRNDSLIWIQIKPDVAIIEAFRILISPDSIQLVNYIEKTYFSGKLEEIKDFINYDISFDMIQNIFLANPTMIFDCEKYIVSTNKESQEIISTENMKTYIDARNKNVRANFLFQALWFSNKNNVRNLIYEPSKKVEIDMQNRDFSIIENLILPKYTSMVVIGDVTNLKFDLEYTKVVINNPTEFPFTIPESYSLIQLKK